MQGVSNASEGAARENVREEAVVEVAAGAEDSQGEHADTAEVAEQVIVATQEDDRDHVNAQADAYDIGQARGEGQGATMVGPRFSFSELEAYEDSEDDDELASLVHQPEEVEEAAGNARLVDSRGEEDGSERVFEIV